MGRRKPATTAPATNGSTTTNLPALTTPGAGMESLGTEDLLIPRLILVQPTSQFEHIDAGTFYMNLTGEQFPAVKAVFLKVTKGRVYFADTTERKPVCGSADRITPSPRFDPPMAPTCDACSAARWSGKEPPACHETYNLLGVMVETGLPFWWSVKSTGIGPTKRLLSAVALRARQGKHFFDAEVTITSQLVTLPGKKYFVPFYAVSWLADSSLYREYYAYYVHQDIDQTFAAEEAANAKPEKASETVADGAGSA